MCDIPLNKPSVRSNSMLELMDLLLLLGFELLFSCVVGVIVALVLRWIMDWMLIKRLESCENTVKNSKSRGVQDEKKARLNEVAMRAAEIAAEAKKAGKPIALNDVPSLALQLGTEFPDVALEIPSYLGKLQKKLGPLLGPEDSG